MDAGARSAVDAPPPSKRHPYSATLLVNSRMTSPGHFQDVRHLVWDIAGSNIQYRPGDVCHVMPENRHSVVMQMLELLRFDPTEIIRVEKHDLGAEVPVRLCCACTLEYAFPPVASLAVADSPPPLQPHYPTPCVLACWRQRCDAIALNQQPRTYCYCIWLLYERV